MTYSHTPYALPYAVAGCFSIAIAVLVWQRRPAPGALPLSLLMLALAVWSLPNAMEHAAQSLDAKLFWVNWEYLGIATVPLLWFFFALEYSEPNVRLSPFQIALLCIIPFLTIILIWTNASHGLVRSNIRLSTQGPIPMITKTYGLWFWVNMIYSYGLLLAGTGLIIRLLRRRSKWYRGQNQSLLVAALLPWLGNAIYLTAQRWTVMLDPTPVVFTLTGIAAAWAMFRHRFLTIVPAAYDSVVQSMGDCLMVLDADNYVVDLNPAAEAFLGITTSEAIGKLPSDIGVFSDETIARYRDIRHAQDEIIWRRDGQERILDVRISPLQERGRLAGRCVLVRDVTAERRGQLAMRESLARLSTLIDNLNLGIVFEDNLGTILHATHQVGEMFHLGQSAQGLVGRKYGEAMGEVERHLADPSDWQRILARVTSGGTVTGSPLRMRDDRLLECDTVPVLVDGERNGRLWLFRDMTERRRFEERVHEVQKMESLGRLAGGVAHDFNNLLTGIIGCTSLLLRHPDMPEIFADDLEIIQRQGWRGAGLVRQILDYSRRSPSQRSWFDLGEHLREVTALLQRTLPDNVHTSLDVEPGCFGISGDAVQIQQMLMNLAVNSADAMPDGGVFEIHLAEMTLVEGETAPLPDMAPGRWASLVVRDSGTGIPREILPRIFEPFFTTKGVGKGTGLGLAQVYGIVKQHDGFITVDSRLGEGTVFTVYLLLTAPEPPGEGTAQVPRAAVASKGTRLLFVDDDEIVRDTSRRVLQELGYVVSTASNGRQALDMLDRDATDYGLVLTDMTMPGIGGERLIDTIRQHWPEMRLILLSGYPIGQETRQRLAREGIPCLQKPLSVEALASWVASVLAQE